MKRINIITILLSLFTLGNPLIVDSVLAETPCQQSCKNTLNYTMARECGQYYNSNPGAYQRCADSAKQNYESCMRRCAAEEGSGSPQVLRQECKGRDCNWNNSLAKIEVQGDSMMLYARGDTGGDGGVEIHHDMPLFRKVIRATITFKIIKGTACIGLDHFGHRLFAGNPWNGAGYEATEVTRAVPPMGDPCIAVVRLSPNSQVELKKIVIEVEQ